MVQGCNRGISVTKSPISRRYIIDSLIGCLKRAQKPGGDSQNRVSKSNKNFNFFLTLGILTAGGVRWVRTPWIWELDLEPPLDLVRFVPEPPLEHPWRAFWRAGTPLDLRARSGTPLADPPLDLDPRENTGHYFNEWSAAVVTRIDNGLWDHSWGGRMN